jgi:hypothetical protein
MIDIQNILYHFREVRYSNNLSMMEVYRTELKLVEVVANLKKNSTDLEQL